MLGVLLIPVYLVGLLLAAIALKFALASAWDSGALVTGFCTVVLAFGLLALPKKKRP